MLLIDAIQEITNEVIAIDNEDFVYLKTNKKVEKQKVEEAEALVEDKKKEYLRLERDNTIEAIKWRIERNADELELGLTPSDDRLDLLSYVQYLRDLPADPDFPNIEIKNFEEWLND